ncbi:MAG: heparinase II/III family protein [Acetobacteraceae bacterium]|nr:heparinase II/III family protein [Acetobacteraceae bacterium]
MPGPLRRLLLIADAAARLGPRAVANRLRHGLLLPLARARLPNAAPPEGPFFRPDPPPPAPPLPRGFAERLAAALPEAAPDWHGPFDPAAHGLALDLFAAGDIRPVWERNRLLALPLLAALHRIAPGAGHLARAEALLARWCAANPPFRGPAWACGQEAALRALHLLLARALLGQDSQPPPAGMAALLSLHARRIAATRAYALAQDNNHPISEAAGAAAIARALGRDDSAEVRRLARLAGRLIAPDGGFSQVSTGYLRLLCDTLSVFAWLHRRAGGAALPPPLPERAAAAARLLGRLASPGSGALPSIGPQDGSRFADLSAAGEADAGASAERALRLFCGEGFGREEDPGAALMGLPAPARPLARPAVWRAAGYAGWEGEGLQAVLRAGPLRFRPGQADLLHLDLRLDGQALLPDAGSPTYNPPPGAPWAGYFETTAAHSTISFDPEGPWGGDQMPRIGRFLFARWPQVEALPDGAALTDRRGNRQERRIRREGRRLVVEDRLSGPFRRAVLRWHLAGEGWRPTAEGVSGPSLAIALEADVPLIPELEAGWRSPSQGLVVPSMVLKVALPAGISRLGSTLLLA